jgi:hypothetical protein
VVFGELEGANTGAGVGLARLEKQFIDVVGQPAVLTHRQSTKQIM